MLLNVEKRAKNEEVTDVDMVQILQKTIKELSDEMEGYAKVGLGGDFNSTGEFAPHVVGYRSKGYGNPAKYEHGWSDSPMGHMEPEEFFNTNPEASEAYRNADAEWENYKKGNYDYQKGKGWVKK